MIHSNVVLAIVVWFLMLIAILLNETVGNLVGDVIFGIHGRQIYSALFAIVVIVALGFYFARLTSGTRWKTWALCAAFTWVLLTAGFAIAILHYMMGWTWQTLMAHSRFWEGGLLGLTLVIQIVAPLLLGLLVNHRAGKRLLARK